MGKTLPERVVERFASDYSGKVFIPKRNNFHFPIFTEQPSLFEEDVFCKEQIPLNAIRGILGLYGELLWKTFLGGNLHQNHHYEKNGSPPSPDFALCQPDISAPENVFIESKMVSCSHELKLPIHQIKRYEWLQLDPLHNREIKIKFAISRHNIRGLESRIRKVDQEERMELFANAICYSLVLPFSIIHQWYHAPQGKFINKKWDPSYEEMANYRREFNPMQRISSRALNEVFSDPEKTLAQMGINIEDYTIDKQNFQGDVTVKTQKPHKIKSFPILFVEEKDPTKILEQFRREHAKEHEEYLLALEEDRVETERRLAEFNLEDDELEEDEVPF